MLGSNFGLHITEDININWIKDTSNYQLGHLLYAQATTRNYEIL